MHLNPGWSPCVAGLITLIACSCGRGGEKPPPPAGGCPSVQPAIGGRSRCPPSTWGRCARVTRGDRAPGVRLRLTSWCTRATASARERRCCSSIRAGRARPSASAQAATASARAELERARSCLGQAQVTRDAKTSALRLAAVEHARTTRLLADQAVSQSNFY